MVGELLGDLLPSRQLGVCQCHAYSEYSQRAPHQVSRFFSVLHQGCCKIRDICGTPHMFWG